MTVHVLGGAPSPELARALERFEGQFLYPLGPGRFFRVVHGEDYPRFFRAIGDGACFVEESKGGVRGVIGVALRDLLMPSGERREVLYVGDLKVDPSARTGKTLLTLARAAEQWVGGRARAAFSVVMDGTRATPPRYTGRMGIPLFAELGKITVLRIPTTGHPPASADEWSTSADRGASCYARLSVGRYASMGGTPGERSVMDPLWLMMPDGRACGRLEDTRRAKRLIADDGDELVSAHLSCFACADERSGVALLGVALSHAERRGFPALFVAVDAPEAIGLCRLLDGLEIVRAPATVYGTGLEPGPAWNINTAEI